MQNTVPLGEGGMLALLGCTDEEAIAFCKDITSKYGLLEPANFNYPGQIVAGGKSVAIDNAIDKAPRFNIKKAVKLQVSAPFHTSMLKPAGDKLKEYSKNLSLMLYQMWIAYITKKVKLQKSLKNKCIILSGGRRASEK